MPRKFFRKYMPHPDRIAEHKSLRMFGSILRRPNLWHLNRYSVSRAFLIGLFWAMIPMPMQMIPSAAMAIRFRANLGLSLALVWITNPLTMGPIWYANYRFGLWLMGQERGFTNVEFTSEWLWDNLMHVWQPLY